ncbi:MAG: hypothetical protein OEY00_01545 [Gammaproteobacteria bacterium]|nr:hypothetical protein [Gammaproteobacteria bacterium]
MFYKKSFIFLLLITPLQFSWAEWSGSVSLEYRHFTEEPLYPNQHDGANSSIAFQPEYNHSWNNGRQLFSFIPYVREDENDEERSQADIRELSWLTASENWELRLGIRKVFWGVTESQHLVDIINQSDLAANIDGEDKFGQPMINLALIGDYGTLDLFVLPYFRERSFPGEEGRLRGLYPDVTRDAIYQSDDEEKHIDYAARWSKSIDVWDIGLSYFNGTSRDPIINPLMDGPPIFVPYYALIQQLGLDLQATVDSWLWKLEYINRDSDFESYNAATLGLEYTWFGNAESPSDLGLVLEYLYDDRGDSAATPFENDIFLGLRVALNDTQSTDALIGFIKDLDKDTTIYSIEASRRVGESWKLSLEARIYESNDATDANLYAIRDDDYVQMELSYYF